MNTPQKIQDIPVKVQKNQEFEDLYESHQKVYPRQVKGPFNQLRWIAVWITQIFFYGSIWLSWNDRQALLFHLSERKFYIFGMVFWPQDFIYLSALLLVCAYGLFWWTAIAGRLWCGYACPQTVYTEIFLKIEHWIEGDRSARMKLDRASFGFFKVSKKALKHGIWILFSLWTGFTFVGYFTPVQELIHNIKSLNLGSWEFFWILFYGFATYGNAGFLREQICKYMCPYARFQGVMFDKDTLTITYDKSRGEPRGKRSKATIDVSDIKQGDCIDCGICVQVCPTGIDIRKGLQIECNGCAACIDACNVVMDKVNLPRGLIRYTTENAIENRNEEFQFRKRIFRPRVVLYTSILLIVISVIVISLFTKHPIKFDIVRDRTNLVRENENGLQENVYQLQIINTAEEAHKVSLSVVGLDNLRLVANTKVDYLLEPGVSQNIIIKVELNSSEVKSGSHPMEFLLNFKDNQLPTRIEKSTFLTRE